MPALVDTTIRLLGQEPLAGRMPTAELLRLAEILDGAGVRVPRGLRRRRASTRAVRRGVESPWERIRALNERTKTPLAMALRGRFLVGSRPVGGDFVRRFVASRRRERDRGLPPPRPAERRREPARGGPRRSRPRARSSTPGSSTAPATRARPRRWWSRRASCLSSAPRACSCTTRRARCSPTAHRSSSATLAEASGLPVGLYCQGAGGNALAAGARGRARRRRPDRLRGLPGRAHAPPRLRRGARDGARRARDWTPAWTSTRSGGRRSSSTSTSATSRSRRSRRESPCAPPSTSCRPASSAALDAHLRAQAAGRPPRRGARRARADPRGGRLAAARVADRADPRLAGAPPRALGEPLPDRRRRAARADRGPLRQPAGADRRDRAARGRPSRAARPRRRHRSISTRCATRRRALPRARRSCCCWRSSAKRPSRC